MSKKTNKPAEEIVDQMIADPVAIDPIEALKAKKAEIETQIAEFKINWAKLQEAKDAITVEIKAAWNAKSAASKQAKTERVNAQVAALEARLAKLQGNA